MRSLLAPMLHFPCCVETVELCMNILQFNEHVCKKIKVAEEERVQCTDCIGKRIFRT